eukprot:CAMPEP_0185178024 /NCGR_PEP_ID=MMETSP1139-20130426/30588_1 /TAXON_ID=298111 /ORGANISM="Pavlova sp., Strain CCMP459" /LENGTH=379 /DNA_ID=CAMNT_0027743835 /DNA_START=153 /DNA_END=1290 /DNA_ORIENTATION=+
MGASASPVTPDPDGRPRKRREKKNKYAKFSKAHEGLGAQIERGEVGPQAAKGGQRRGETSDAVVEEQRDRNRILFPDAAAVDPDDPSTFGFLEIGRVVGAHGIRGHVKVHSFTDFGEERLCTPGERFIKAPSRLAPRPVELASGVRSRKLKDGQGAMYNILLDGFSSRDEAQALKGCILFARVEATLRNLQEDEYLVADLVGCEVLLAEDRDHAVGTVVGLICADDITGNSALGNDILDVETVAPLGEEPDRVFIPFVPAICPEVDVEAKRIYIEPVPGLLDLTQPVADEEVFIRGLLPMARDDPLSTEAGTGDAAMSRDDELDDPNVDCRACGCARCDPSSMWVVAACVASRRCCCCTVLMGAPSLDSLLRRRAIRRE